MPWEVYHQLPPCLTYEASLSHRMPSSQYRLKFAHVQFAMKSHHCGFEHAACGFSINSLTYTEVKDYESKECRSTTLLSVDAELHRTSC
jgi:hypothetical protein